MILALPRSLAYTRRIDCFMDKDEKDALSRIVAIECRYDDI